MQFSNYDFIDSKSFAGKIILTSFPGLNSNGLFEETILANELEIFKNYNCSSITSFVEDSEFEKLCDKTLFVKNIYEHKLHWYHLPHQNIFLKNQHLNFHDDHLSLHEWDRRPHR